MDRKAIAAIALCVLFLVFYRPILKMVGLDKHLEAPQRPTPTEPAPDTARAPAETAPATPAPTPAPAPAAVEPQTPPASLSASDVRPVETVMEQTYTIETPLYRATFSNVGARLVAVELKQFASAHANGKNGGFKRGSQVPTGSRVVLAGGPLFGIDLGTDERLRSLADVGYAVEESLDAAGDRRVLAFVLRDSAGFELRQTYRVRSGDYGLELAVEMRGIPEGWGITEYSLTSRSWPLITEADLPADTRTVRALSMVGTNMHREGAQGLANKGPKRFDGNAAWAMVQSRYFIAGVAVEQGTTRGVVSSGEQRTLSPDQVAQLPPKAPSQQSVAVNTLVMAVPTASAPVHRFLLYAGPSELFRLEKIGYGLERAVDLGWNWVRPFSGFLLQVLNWLFAAIRNYGLAIVALATLVRVLLHPLNMMSMKSMRSMQRLQPEMERIREKYKSDPQAMNTAVMALYKDNKVNPAGGCLPMLLQMPLFIALYQVLFNAIELRQAPFMLWMNDLSAPDQLFTIAGFPVRILPLLMTGSGFLQMKMTPTDPRQVTTMYMMNVVMLVFFYNLPSGLVLYWTVMNLLTALQQWMVLRQDDGAAPVVVTDVKPVKGKGKGKGRG